MIKVIGNNFERIMIKDLNDVIYYKQIKNYTNQEYDNSKDLKNEIQKGKILKIEETPDCRGSIGYQSIALQNTTPQGININDLRTVLKELLPDLSDNIIKSSVRDMAPLLVGLIRQELSQISITKQNTVEQNKSNFQGPDYIPTVTTEGMISNIEIKKIEVSEDSTLEALETLRNLNKSK